MYYAIMIPIDGSYIYLMDQENKYPKRFTAEQAIDYIEFWDVNSVMLAVGYPEELYEELKAEYESGVRV